MILNSERNRHIFDPLMPEVYANGEARRKSRFDCHGLPGSSLGWEKFLKSVGRGAVLANQSEVILASANASQAGPGIFPPAPL